jgi:hypothetical protein
MLQRFLKSSRKRAKAKPRIRAFVSYSHEDRVLVEPVVRLLRMTRNDVFLDFQSIELGTPWREEISTALAQAQVGIVFWCKHAHQSSHVGREWRAGIGMRKRLLPVILDNTRMPRGLEGFQGVDFRALASSVHRNASDTADAFASDGKRQRLSAFNPIPFIILIGALFTSEFWSSIGNIFTTDYSELWSTLLRKISDGFHGLWGVIGRVSTGDFEPLYSSTRARVISGIVIGIACLFAVNRMARLLQIKRMADQLHKELVKR